MSKIEIVKPKETGSFPLYCYSKNGGMIVLFNSEHSGTVIMEDQNTHNGHYKEGNHYDDLTSCFSMDWVIMSLDTIIEITV